MKTKEDYSKEAKEFVRRRLSYELAGSQRILTLIDDAAVQIAKIAYAYHISPTAFRFSSNEELNTQVNAIIDSLREDILFTMEWCAIKVDEENQDIIIDHLAVRYEELSVLDKIDNHLARFKIEIEALVTSALLIGYTQPKALEQIGRAFTGTPYKSTLVRQANKMASVPVFAELLENNRSSQAGLTRLERFLVSDAWMWYDYDKIQRDGFRFYGIMRGSSYPCDLCDSLVGVHLVEEGLLVPAHARCCCIQYPINDSEL